MERKTLSNSKTKFRVLAFLLVTLICSVILLKAEFILRNSGYYPGTITQYLNFKIDDALEETGEYATDSFGIFRVSKTGVDRLCEFMSTDFEKAGPDKRHQNPFYGFIDSLKAKRDEGIVLTASDSAYLNYFNQPVNEQGFRSIPFEPVNSKAKKILLLGDSFTWGDDSDPITNSFADLLATKGYVVYNSGIIATDPAQYQRIAEVWAPQLKPDVIVVNFYCGNDFMFYERNPDECKPMHFATTVGFLESSPNGKYCFPDFWTAYQFYKGFYGIPPNTVFNRICQQSCLLSKLWLIFRKLGLVNNITNFNEYSPEVFSKYLVPCPSEIFSYSVSEKHLTEIRKVANENGAVFILAMIPNLTSTDSNVIKHNLDDIFGKLEYHLQGNLTLDDYIPYPNGHFNNRGHEKYAAFLDSIISTRLSSYP